MLGWTASLIVILAALLGLEAGSPGVTRSVITASLKVYRISQQHTGSRLCERFPDRAEIAVCGGS